MKLRNSVKGIIIRNKEILFNKMYANKSNEEFYVLPGGGQIEGETFIETLKRECMEELGAEVVVKDLILIREYIGKNHEFSEEHKDIHQIGYMFNCDLLSEVDKTKISQYDYQQIGHTWIKISELEKWNVYPQVLKKVFDINGNIIKPIYLGDVN